MAIRSIHSKNFRKYKKVQKLKITLNPRPTSN